MFDLTKDYGKNVLSLEILEKRLDKSVYAEYIDVLEKGLALSKETADGVAEAMKNWALENGATHFTHWFQPMNNINAGKHDSFISKKNGKMILDFSSKELIQGEPDASSFPSGGLRATFEARGYTIWDPSSPAFIRDKTLYIPTAFCAYTGEALDQRTPLLRSMSAVSKEGVRVLRALGDTETTRIFSEVGAEQEYFLIDREKYEKRLDLKLCGRTLFGAKPPKGQEMDDHYCGRIRIRVSEFMRQLDEELWALGINSKTKHNEVAPAQHELAPIYEVTNIGCDHNQLTMDVMRYVAKKNNLACILHEKPFSYISGSGKHNNWSLSTNSGKRLFVPGKNPTENYEFMLFLAAFIEATDKYADLMRMAAASAGNDLRIGAHEAPPAIISIYLGESLTRNFFEFALGRHKEELSPDRFRSVESLPSLEKDNADRNRTSPVAFTGNKFEFRMIGSSASIAFTNAVINTAVAEVLSGYADRLEAAKNKKDEVENIVGDVAFNHSKIIFNGNNYSPKWKTEAKRRRLPEYRTTVDVASAIINKKNVNLLADMGILTEPECRARYEIFLEEYIKILSIEVLTLLEIVNRQILPAVLKFTAETAGTFNSLSAAGKKSRAATALLDTLIILSDKIAKEAEVLSTLFEGCDKKKLAERAAYFRDRINVSKDTLRNHIDEAEKIVPADIWPVPTYTDLLYRI